MHEEMYISYYVKLKGNSVIPYMVFSLSNEEILSTEKILKFLK